MSKERGKNFTVLSRQKAKEEKRAAALRSNLKRRKVQNRNRAEKRRSEPAVNGGLNVKKP